MSHISYFIKYQRKKLKLTQEELALKAGVGIRFMRELEQGKETLQLNKVNQVLNLFGCSLIPTKNQVDAYDIFFNFMNKAVKIVLKNRLVKYGIILKEMVDIKEQKIASWKFVPNKKAIIYLQKPDANLTEIILHQDIQTIEEQ